MDFDQILGIGVVAAVVILLGGSGWLISRDQDNTQLRAIACIEAGNQFVSGDCFAGPNPFPVPLAGAGDNTPRRW